MRVSFVVYGKPQPQEQNRTVPILRKLPDGRKVPVTRTKADGTVVPVMIHPNPKDTVNWRSDAKSAALAAMNQALGDDLLEGPLRMDVTIFIARPEYLCKPRELKADAGPRWAPRTPDRSNVMKNLEDALQGVCYANDAQLVAGECRKFYCAAKGHGDVRPRTEVVIETIEHVVSTITQQLPAASSIGLGL
jgi:Holliday junction resolvase RusA-like endonuclease